MEHLGTDPGTMMLETPSTETSSPAWQGEIIDAQLTTASSVEVGNFMLFFIIKYAAVVMCGC